MRRVDVPLERSNAASVVVASVSTTEATIFMVVVMFFLSLWLFLYMWFDVAVSRTTVVCRPKKVCLREPPRFFLVALIFFSIASSFFYFFFLPATKNDKQIFEIQKSQRYK